MHVVLPATPAILTGTSVRRCQDREEGKRAGRRLDRRRAHHVTGAQPITAGLQTGGLQPYFVWLVPWLRNWKISHKNPDFWFPLKNPIYHTWAHIPAWKQRASLPEKQSTPCNPASSQSPLPSGPAPCTGLTTCLLPISIWDYNPWLSTG